MTNVLLPIDGSDYALRGVSRVIAERSNYRAPEETQIHLVNVQPPLPHDISRFVSDDQIQAFHRDEAEEALASARAMLDAAGVPYVVHAKVGPIAEEIVRLADCLGAEQIVMGTHGRTALVDLLMGSVALKVLHLTKIPVLLVN